MFNFYHAKMLTSREENEMKKLLALATAAFCVISLGACATNNGGTSTPNTSGGRIYLCGYREMGCGI